MSCQSSRREQSANSEKKNWAMFLNELRVPCKNLSSLERKKNNKMPKIRHAMVNALSPSVGALPCEKD